MRLAAFLVSRPEVNAGALPAAAPKQRGERNPHLLSREVARVGGLGRWK
jgi:hypothetical protein